MSHDFSSLARLHCRAGDAVASEIIGYVKSTGLVRYINAGVKRGLPAPLPETPAAVRPALEITVEDHATLGIRASELDTGGDSILVARRYGGARESMTIGKILQSANGILKLEIR